jgi:hypothetical protein
MHMMCAAGRLCRICAMNAFSFGIPALFALISLAWYVGVIVLLVKIWKKVRHLPG